MRQRLPLAWLLRLVLGLGLGRQQLQRVVVERRPDEQRAARRGRAREPQRGLEQHSQALVKEPRVDCQRLKNHRHSVAPVPRKQLH